MTGPERRVRNIARRWRNVPPRRLAKLAGIRVEVARQILSDVEEHRRRVA